MTTLIRFNLDKNTGLFFREKYVRKFILITKFFEKTNVNYIENEFKGYQWYTKQLKKKKFINFPIISKNEHYIDYQIIFGKKHKFWNNAVFKSNLVNKVIKHYIQVWPKKTKVPFHGDLTLDNIFFLDNDNVIFIDWENFKKKDEWGLDICYFLISILVLPLISSEEKKISEKNLSQTNFYWKTFIKNKKFKYMNNPVLYFKKIIKNRWHFIFKINPNIEKQLLEVFK